MVYVYSGKGWTESPISPPPEVSVDIAVNGIRLTAIACTPEKLDLLATGFLYLNGIINSTGEISKIDIDMESGRISVKLTKDEFPVPEKYLSSGGFGGDVLAAGEPPVKAAAQGFTIGARKLIRLVEAVVDRGVLYRRSGGVHASAVCSEDEVLAHVEDIGRQNTMDKVIGGCLLRGIPFNDKVLISTGRLSSEMMLKAARLGIPLVASLSSPTQKAVSLADSAGIAVAGYVKNGQIIAYCHNNKIIIDK